MAEGQKGSDTCSYDIHFDTVNVHTRPHTVSYTSADDNLGNDINANKLVIKADELQTFDDLDVS